MRGTSLSSTIFMMLQLKAHFKICNGVSYPILAAFGCFHSIAPRRSRSKPARPSRGGVEGTRNVPKTHFNPVGFKITSRV